MVNRNIEAFVDAVESVASANVRINANRLLIVCRLSSSLSITLNRLLGIKKIFIFITVVLTYPRSQRAQIVASSLLTHFVLDLVTSIGKKIYINFIRNHLMLTIWFQGDGGGPLQIDLAVPYCMHDLIGIISFGRKCNIKYPNVYTRVSHFVPWIVSKVWPWITGKNTSLSRSLSLADTFKWKT